MTAAPVAIIPIRSLGGKSRLAPQLDTAARTAVIRELATRAIRASIDASIRVIVVSQDAEVASLAHSLGASVAADPRTGLDDAARTGVAAAAGEPWIVLHADLPFVTPGAIRPIAERAARGRTVIVPSLDGGTNVLSASGPFPFSFGPGSFHRHLARRPDAEVVVDARLGIDVDTPAHASALGLPNLFT